MAAISRGYPAPRQSAPEVPPHALRLLRRPRRSLPQDWRRRPCHPVLRSALRLAPTSTVILLKLGNAQVDWEAWPRVEATMRHVIALTPNDPVAWGLSASRCSSKTRPPKPGPPSTRPRARSRPFRAAQLPRAMLVRAGDLDGAEKEFRAALKILPTNADWQANLAASSPLRAPSRSPIPLRASDQTKTRSPGPHLNTPDCWRTSTSPPKRSSKRKAAVLADPASRPPTNSGASCSPVSTTRIAPSAS